MFYINYLINKGEVSCIQVILLACLMIRRLKKDVLHQLPACLMIRRLKKDVLHQLPNKQRWGIMYTSHTTCLSYD